MFSVILPARPCLTDYQAISPTQFAFSFPLAPTFSHIVVFLLPGQTLPPDTAAGVHLLLPGQADFTFLGAIANEKPSAIFKVTLPSGPSGMNGNASQAVVNLGISIEPVPNIQAQLAALESRSQSTANAASNSVPSTKVLARRIIENAFNFLSGFSGTAAGGLEVVPLKAFQDWWTKFERRVEMDPSFLEKTEG